MNRRWFLATAAGGLATLSGCLGYQVQSEGEIRQRRNRIESLQSTVQAKGDEMEALEANNQQFKQQLERRQKRAVAGKYADALTIRKEATAAWNEAQSLWQDRQFRPATIQFGRAGGRWDGARIQFGQAGDLAGSLGENDAKNLCVTAGNHCGLMTNACTRLANAASAYANGNRQQGNQQAQRGKNAANRAGQHSIAPLSEMENRLGLSG